MNNYTLQVYRNAYPFGVGGLRPVRYASTEGEMCYELLDRVVIGGVPNNKDEARIIDIVYKVDIGSVLRYKFRK